MFKNIPNLITLAGFSCGLFTILLACKENISGLILLLLPLAVLCDVMDGWVARKLGVSSKIGFHLDSLADVVSFGVAPVVLLTRYYGDDYLSLIIFSLIALCGVYRLARFNSNPTSHEKEPFYEGIPITCTGFIIPLVIHLDVSYNLAIGFVLLISLLMVSKVRIPKLF
jgi:CDP-diacylglycerol--serine O-phosphatidyltransferase